MKLFRGLLSALLVILIAGVTHAQEEPIYENPNSVRPIPEYEQFYKKRVWRRMDLKEKQNQGFFAKGNEITKIIMDAVEAGILTPYLNDSLVREMPLEDYKKNLLPEGMDEPSDEEADLGWGDDGGWGEDSGWGDEGDGGEEEEPAQEISYDFLPQDISILHVVEDVIFDRRRSRLYYDIQAITMIVPAEQFTTGVYRQVATFRYKDLEALFRSMPNEAIWFNRQNSAEHKNIADAFLLRLFHAPLYQLENPENNAIADIYGEGKRAMVASEWQEMMLLEKEHNLWEY
jgi:hypothetical protein